MNKKIFNNIQKILKSKSYHNSLNNEEFKKLLIRLIFKYKKDVDLVTLLDIYKQIYAYFRGYDVIDFLLEDKDITEIMINGFNQIFIEKGGHIEKTDLSFSSDDRYRDIVRRIAEISGREVNLSNPIVDSRLNDGSRVNIVLDPISDGKVCTTIRKFSNNPYTLDDLVIFGSINNDIASFLKKIVRAKYNIFISGGTGSGKTTLLNALSFYIPPDERIITIEDSRELQLNKTGNSNLISLQTRSTNNFSKTNINMKSLIKTSLRMRPDRIIVGEVRGDETFDMLQAMNTGHDGSISTGHANSISDILIRLEFMLMQTGENIPLSAIKSQICSAIDICIHITRMSDSSRKVTEISELLNISNGEIQLNTLYKFNIKSKGENCIIGDWIKKGSIQHDEKWNLLYKNINS